MTNRTADNGLFSVTKREAVTRREPVVGQPMKSARDRRSMPAGFKV